MNDNLDLKYTGNVFVDAGVYALLNYFNISINEVKIDHLKELSLFISNLYLKKMGDKQPSWWSDVNTLFPNSILVNNKFKGNRQEMYLKELNYLIDNIGPITDSGDCIACGNRNSKKLFLKTQVPLTGSGSLKNYFSFAEEGVSYCPLCALLVQFSPLFIYKTGRRTKNDPKIMLLLHSNSSKVMKCWAKKAGNNLNAQISSGNYSGCFTEGFSNLSNAVFNIIQEMIYRYDERWINENPSLNFYYFTNFNKGADLEIFSFPSNVFRFLAYIPPDQHHNWNLIIKKAYKNVKWDKIKEFEEYKNNPNEVYNRLLKNKTILRFFYDFKLKKALCSWNLIKYYMREVQNMDDNRINAIKNLGDNLSRYIKDANNKKVLSNLENAKNYNSFRNILRKIIKNKMANSDDDLLFTFDDYVVNLFPDGKSWRETQDLLLFRIYENLHEWLIEMNYVEEIEDVEDE